MSAQKAKKPLRVGGLFFFIALITFFLIACACLIAIIPVLLKGSLRSFLVFGGGAVFGALGAKFMVRGHLSVFIHELKHMIVAILAGNRPKGMRVAKDSGHFEYAYSEDTAGYNAFISLAPYILPLFSAVALPAAIFIYKGVDERVISLVGIAYGVDLLLNLRDISPRQTDFSHLYGGFYIGILYVMALNIIILSTLLAWVTVGVPGIQELFWGVFSIMASHRPG